MRIMVDRERCVGAGQCVLAAPAVFDQSEDGLVVVREYDAAQLDADPVYEAEEICPARAIRVFTR